MITRNFQTRRTNSKIFHGDRLTSKYFSRQANSTAELQKLITYAAALDIGVTIRFHGALSINTNTGKILTYTQYQELKYNKDKDYVEQVIFDDEGETRPWLGAMVVAVPTAYPKTKVLIQNVHEQINSKLVDGGVSTAGVWVDPDNTQVDMDSCGWAYEETPRFTVDFFTSVPFEDSDIDTADWTQETPFTTTGYSKRVGF
jgi:hypothetical protein